MAKIWICCRSLCSVGLFHRHGLWNHLFPLVIWESIVFGSVGHSQQRLPELSGVGNWVESKRFWKSSGCRTRLLSTHSKDKQHRSGFGSVSRSSNTARKSWVKILWVGESRKHPQPMAQPTSGRSTQQMPLFKIFIAGLTVGEKSLHAQFVVPFRNHTILRWKIYQMSLLVFGYRDDILGIQVRVQFECSFQGKISKVRWKRIDHFILVSTPEFGLIRKLRAR